jgi:hypothetical protein
MTSFGTVSSLTIFRLIFPWKVAGNSQKIEDSFFAASTYIYVFLYTVYSIENIRQKYGTKVPIHAKEPSRWKR